MWIFDFWVRSQVNKGSFRQEQNKETDLQYSIFSVNVSLTSQLPLPRRYSPHFHLQPFSAYDWQYFITRSISDARMKCAWAARRSKENSTSTCVEYFRILLLHLLARCRLRLKTWEGWWVTPTRTWEILYAGCGRRCVVIVILRLHGKKG